MAEENWRTVKKKGWEKKDNWRGTQGVTGNRHFSTTGQLAFSRSRSTTSRDQRNLQTTSTSTATRPIGLNSRTITIISKDDIKSNNLLNPHFVNNLVDNQSTEEITSFIISNMEDYNQILTSNISKELLIALLKLSAKACENPFVTSKCYMLKGILQKNFVRTICSFLSGLVMDDNTDDEFWLSFGNVLDDLLLILENAMQFIPMTLWEQIQTVAKTITLVLPVLQKNKKIILTEDFDNRMAGLNDNLLKIEKKFKKLEPNVIKNVANHESEEDGPEEDYRFVNLYPSTEELTIPERPYLRKNIVKGQYASLQQYLDIHFRLMKEDFLGPIRADICDYLNTTKRQFFNIKVHENIEFLKRDIQRNTVCFEIRLNVSQALQNMLQTGQNKRLIHGTLLFFSSDNFKSIFCGKIVSNDDLKNGILRINLPHNDHIDYTKKYSVIECVIFFEPYYQVLTVLQRLSQNQFPMEKYILRVETSNISHPKYMENVRSVNFPSGLNSSQIEALNAALYKEFVIIQGPPGTGKTFLGMTLVKMLLNQKQSWKDAGPILIVCYTNHALEQFLDGLSNITDKLVRLGRNSTDLRDADLKYGAEGKLMTYLNTKFNIRKEYYSHLYDGQFNPFDADFRTLVNSLKYRCRRKNYMIHDFNEVHSVPEEIRKWLIDKKLLADYFRLLKNIEREIQIMKSKIENVFDNEKHAILVETMRGNEVEYYFQDIEFFCWLLCDDGTISKEANKVEGPIANSALEQERTYNLLCNFVLQQSEEYSDLKGNEQLDVSKLNQAADDLRSYINSGEVIQQADRRYLNEQLDFLLKKINYLKLCLKTEFGPPEVEFDQLPDPYMIQSKHRWQLYKRSYELYKTKLRQQLEELSNRYQRKYDYYNDLREIDNVKLLKEMDIVGMTTTCAARLKSTLDALKCPIVIVEEAAEVLESHIVTALTKDCQHLILLGDHQQLRPATSDYTIEKKYKLGISLFERMVQNNVECHTLNVQHRMRPEISSLISPLFYKELFNHQSVEIYPFVSGVDHPLYFIDHTEPEELYGDSSKINMHEAKFLIKLAIYLLNNDYRPEDITILAAYLGQSYILKKEQQQEQLLHPDLNIEKVRITVVDNFQGEENKIILLSLVRSNSENKVGFLSIDNRVCVALSRAKVGLYIMGNMTQLCGATDIWKSIRATLESQQAIGRYLALRCKNHKEHLTFVSKAADFLKVPEGGCKQTCNTVLDCGHKCIKLCHGYDVNHKLYNCKEPCTQLLCDKDEHKCKKQCFEKCGHCHYPVIFKLPCGHEKILKCSIDIVKYQCTETIEIQLDCGHLQDIPCYLKAVTIEKRKAIKPGDEQTENTELIPFSCKFEIEKVITKCGHAQTVPCFQVETYKCQYELEITLECSHKKMIRCHLTEETIACSAVCDKPLDCGHKCRRICHADDAYHLVNQCLERCTKNLRGCNNTESHPKCQSLCNKPCHLCKKIVMKSYTRCSHVEAIECYEAKGTRQCRKPCGKKLSCGHRCQKRCFEMCLLCKETTFKTIPECGHKIKLKCTETPNQDKCKKACAKTLGCGHSCTNRCNEPCNKKCHKQCQKMLDCGHDCIRRCCEDCACKTEVSPQCGHTIFIKCGDKLSSEKCKKISRKILECGHEIILPCNKPMAEAICEAVFAKTLPCGHISLGKCNESVADIKCWKRCEKPLECSHICTKVCHEPCTKECMERCNKKLECNHPCQARCSQPCTPLNKCLLPCEKILKCNHTCKKRCYQSCAKSCSEQCENTIPCGHRCSNTCGDECVAVCEEKCDKKLDCGHHCRELCGKPCPESCQRRCKKTLSCDHRCSKNCSEACDTECKSECGKLLDCGHKCQNLCGQPCTQTCQIPCRKQLECDHLCPEKCGDLCTPLSQCRRPCKKTLPCKHIKCTNFCNEPCIDCTERCTKKLDCGHNCINQCNEKCACSIVKSSDCVHYVRGKCGDTPTKLMCTQQCGKLLECGHNCKRPCSEECICLESCRRRLTCGCLCIKFSCSEPCECRNGCEKEAVL